MTDLTSEEEATLRHEYQKYLIRCRGMESTQKREFLYPMSFDDWFRASADEAKDRAKYQD